MIGLLTAEQSKLTDRYAIQTLGIPENLLVEHAALGALAALRKRFGGSLFGLRGLIVAGNGNNGADALALGRLLILEGCPNLAIFTAEGKKSPGFEFQKKILTKLGLKWANKFPIAPFDFVIDGLFGTGLNRPLEKPANLIIEKLNSYQGKSWILSLDIPSGLNADTGMNWGNAVTACETVTFGGLKKGLVTGLAANHVGRLTLSPLPIPTTIPQLKWDSFLVEKKDIQLPPRLPSSHKGNHGHVYIFGGEGDKAGAGVLAGTGALRAGAGWVSLVVKDDAGRLLPAELMVRKLDDRLFSENGTFVLGPGMGTDLSQVELLKRILETKWPLVLDADALTLISEQPKLFAQILKNRKPPILLTPHPKEAARLLGISVESVQKDRFTAAKRIADYFNAVCILKGKGSIIASPSEKCTYVVDKGSPALAKGGSGDVLCGILAALLSQGLNAKQAAFAGVFIHGVASERMSERLGETFSPLASEVANFLGLAIGEILS